MDLGGRGGGRDWEAWGRTAVQMQHTREDEEREGEQKDIIKMIEIQGIHFET